MNKHKQLSQIVMKQGAICAGLLMLSIGAYVFTDSLVTDSVPAKTKANQAFQTDQMEIGNLTSQIDKSSLAETRFIAIQQERENTNFSTDSEILKDWLRSAKNQYRLADNFKLSLTGEKPGNNKELAGSHYEVFEHPGMKLEFNAISDMHVISFLQDLVRHAPGFIRFENVSIKRTNDIDANFIDQLRSGAAPPLVEVKIEFNWIGLKEKTKKSGAPASGEESR